MRTSTLASLLFLCGSTAALANVASLPGEPQSTNNGMAMNDMMSNDATSNDMAPDPMPRNEAIPMPTATPNAMNNDMAPPPPR